MIDGKLSRRAALGGLLLVPSFGLVRASRAAPLCANTRSGAVQLSGASTVCDFVVQTLADGSLSSISFSDFKIDEIKPGAKLEKLFAAYHTFKAQAGDAPAYLRRVAVGGARDSEGVSGTVSVDMRVGAVGGRRSWRIEGGHSDVTFALEGPRQRLRDGQVLPIVVRTSVRVRRVKDRAFLNFAIDDLTYVHAG